MREILGFIVKMLPYVAAFALIYLPLRALTRRHGVLRLRHEAALMVFHLLLVAILSQTITPSGGLPSFTFAISHGNDYYNFIPFNALRRLSRMQGKEGFASYLTINILGNILLFVPLGFAYRLCLKRSLTASALFGFCFSLSIELFQVLLPRITDIDDLIMNTLGTFIGGVLYTIVFSRLPEKAVLYRPTRIDAKAQCANTTSPS